MFELDRVESNIANAVDALDKGEVNGITVHCSNWNHSRLYIGGEKITREIIELYLTIQNKKRLKLKLKLKAL